MPDTNTAERLARLEAVEQIRALKARYAAACDDHYNPEVIASLFTEDGVWDGGERYGIYRGQDEILKFFRDVKDLVPWAMHYIVSPNITVGEDPQSATGTWYLWQTCNHKVDDEYVAMMIAGRYSDVYVYEPDGWKMSELHLTLEAITPMLEGWATRRFYDRAGG